MSRFLVLNFQDFGLDHHITKTIQSHTLFCICCLVNDAPLLSLSNCEHGKYLDHFSKPTDFGLDHHITKTIQSHTLFCICCLVNDAPLLSLSNCEHGKYLDHFSKPTTRSYKEVICFQCHSILKKIDVFRKQVEESFRILNDEAFSIDATKNRKKLTTLETKMAVNIYLPPLKTILINHEHQSNQSNSNSEYRTVKNKETSQSSQSKLNLEHTIDKTEDIERTEESKKGYTLSEGIKREESMLEIKIEPMETVNAYDDVITVTETTIQPLKKNTKIKTIKLSSKQLTRERLSLAQSEAYLKHPYRCEHCLLGFNYEDNIQDHMKRKHGPKAGGVTCEICLQVLHPPGSLNAHNFRHYTRYQCEVCGKRYTIFNDALKHYREAHTKWDPTYKCRHCDFTATKYSQLTLHKLKHERFPCQDCGLVLTSMSSLRRHMLITHKKSIYKCRKCNTTYDSEPSYVAHMRTHGADARCDQCGITFKSWYSYSAHLVLSSQHARRDKYNCEECGMKFGSATHLRIHATMRHQRRVAHKCPHCSKTFILPVELKQHIRKLHSERRLNLSICHHCGKAYKNRIHLIRHMEESHSQKLQKIKKAKKKVINK